MKLMFNDEELARRVPVWTALSELFFDTELDDISYQHIADIIKASGFPVSEIETILADEVAPVFAINLRTVAGEGFGWSDVEVCEKVLNSLKRKPLLTESILPRAWLRASRMRPVRLHFQRIKQLINKQ